MKSLKEFIAKKLLFVRHTLGNSLKNEILSYTRKKASKQQMFSGFFIFR